ncbi:hypothetical protein LX36DRAFT_658366 [Colletotrichum falcatum]|nr:hypothetical protein LX36DRAFT_658366 [Colletotrichum falcatum]
MSTLLGCLFAGLAVRSRVRSRTLPAIGVPGVCCAHVNAHVNAQEREPSAATVLIDSRLQSAIPLPSVAGVYKRDACRVPRPWLGSSRLETQKRVTLTVPGVGRRP